MSWRWVRSGALLEAFALARTWNTTGREMHFSMRRAQPFVAKAAPHEGYAPSNSDVAAWEEATAQKAAMGRGMFSSGAGRPIEDDPRGYDCDSEDCPGVADNVRAIRR